MSRELDRPMPASTNAERLVLGAILIDPDAFPEVAALLDPGDWALDGHRLIFDAMAELRNGGEAVDRITVTNELMKRGNLEAVGGFSYIVELDDCLPQIYNVGSYARIVRDKSRLRRVIHIGSTMMDRAFLDQEPAADIAASVGTDLMGLDSAGTTGLEVPAQIIEAAGGLQKFLAPDRRRGLGTPWEPLTALTGGLRAGELFVIAGRPAMGKTALAMNIADYVAARHHKPVAVFSLEMSKDSLLTRAICSRARVDMQRLVHDHLTAEERHRLQLAATELTEAPLHIDDTSGITPPGIHAKCQALKARAGELGLVVIDYLQLMEAPGRYSNRTEQVSYLSRSIKLLARDLGVPVILLSQLSRAVEARADKVPQLSDLRESGSIEQDADMVAFVFREEYYKPDREDLKGMADFIMAKQRNGPIGRFKLAWIKQFLRFEMLAADYEETGEEV